MADKAHGRIDRKLAAMERHLTEIYTEAQGGIQKKAAAYFEKFAKADEEKRDLVKIGRLTEAEYEAWRKGKMMYGKRFTELKENIAQQLLHVNETATAYINGQLPEVYSLGYNALESSVDGVGGYSFTLVDADTVRTLATADGSLLPSRVLDPAKDIPWNMKKVNAQVLQGILQGESIPDIAGRMQNVAEMNRTAAVRTARTMVTGAENKGRLDSYARAEADGIMLQKEWLATNDGRVRHWHAELDGQLRDREDPFENAVGKIMFPGDPSADGANVYNCRCSMAAKVIGFAKNVLTSSKNNGIMYGEKIERSVGAKSPTYPIVKYPDTDIHVDFVIGSRPVYPPDHIIAGKGCKTRKKIDDIDRLVSTYNCPADGWRKEKAVFEVYDDLGEIRQVELHWYQHERIGKVEYKVKTRGGRVFIDEWEN